MQREANVARLRVLQKVDLWKRLAMVWRKCWQKIEDKNFWILAMNWPERERFKLESVERVSRIDSNCQRDVIRDIKKKIVKNLIQKKPKLKYCSLLMTEEK